MENPWKEFEMGQGPLVCPSDEEKVALYNQTNGRKADHFLHLDLIPEPYIGDLNKCQFLILMANPGLSERDQGDHKSPKLRELAIQNLNQKESDWPFYLLSPETRKFSGGEYWSRRLGGLAREIAVSEDLDSESALMEVSRRVAVAEMHPYHSKKFHGSETLLSLDSSRFTHVLVNKAIKRGCSVLVARGLTLWNQKLEKLPPSFLTLRSSQASGELKSGNLLRSSLENVDLGRLVSGG